MRTLNIDIETFSSVDIGKSGAYKYAMSDDFQILLFAYSVDGQDVNCLIVCDYNKGKKTWNWVCLSMKSK